MTDTIQLAGGPVRPRRLLGLPGDRYSAFTRLVAALYDRWPPARSTAEALGRIAAEPVAELAGLFALTVVPATGAWEAELARGLADVVRHECATGTLRGADGDAIRVHVWCLADSQLAGAHDLETFRAVGFLFATAPGLEELI
jgi:hypothetical protein